MPRDKTTDATGPGLQAANDNSEPESAGQISKTAKNTRKVISQLPKSLAILPGEVELLEAYLPALLDLIAANDNTPL